MPSSLCLALMVLSESRDLFWTDHFNIPSFYNTCDDIIVKDVSKLRRLKENGSYMTLISSESTESQRELAKVGKSKLEIVFVIYFFHVSRG